MIWPFSIMRDLEIRVSSLEGDYKSLQEKYWDLRRSIEMTYDYLGVVREKQVVREHLTKKGGPENSIRKGTGDE